MTSASVAAINEASVPAWNPGVARQRRADSTLSQGPKLTKRLGSTAEHRQLDRVAGAMTVFALVDVPGELGVSGVR
jgi:hypothetical protein